MPRFTYEGNRPGSEENQAIMLSCGTVRLGEEFEASEEEVARIEHLFVFRYEADGNAAPQAREVPPPAPAPVQTDKKQDDKAEAKPTAHDDSPGGDD